MDNSRLVLKDSQFDMIISQFWYGETQLWGIFDMNSQFYLKKNQFNLKMFNFTQKFFILIGNIPNFGMETQFWSPMKTFLIYLENSQLHLRNSQFSLKNSHFDWENSQFDLRKSSILELT